MQVGTLAIQHIFEKDVLYCVPLYQRPYVWSENEQLAPLWDDLRDLAEAIAARRPTRAHFLGASVQDRPSVPPGHIETRLLIDGQQRLTTLQIFLKAFRDVVATKGSEPYTRALEKLIANNHPLSTSPHEQYKVWPTNADRDDFRAVMGAAGRADLLKHLGLRVNASAAARNIPDAYLFFEAAIRSWIDDDAQAVESKIASLYSAARDNVRLVVIDLDEKDDAQTIFETLNARGTPLLSADLVKNSLLNELQREGVDAESAYRNYWQAFDRDAGFWREKVGRGHAQRARIELFLQHTLTLLTGGTVSASHLYTAYRDYARGPDAGSAFDRVKKLHTYGAIFMRLQDRYPISRIASFFERLETLDVITAWPFILALFEKIEDHPEALQAALADVESFLVRRMVCRLSTRGYAEVFAKLTGAITGTAAEIRTAVRQALLAGTAETDRWPDDGEFKAAWTGNPLYENITRPRLRMLLEALEAGLRGHFAETQEVPKNLTIEHILPQNWREHWPLPEGGSAEARQRALHSIGNLTLLNEKLNPYQSNRPWFDGRQPESGKREALKASSVLYLNKALCDYADWSETKIAERSLVLFNLAVRVWPR